MTYSEITEIARHGKLGKLPNFIGYFKWDFGSNSLIFCNGDYKCPAESLDILNRNDFYYIIWIFFLEVIWRANIPDVTIIN